MTIKINISKASVMVWERERNTASGNPVYSFRIEDENGKAYEGKTRPNAGFVYGLASVKETLSNVVIAITPSGRVYMDDAEQEYQK
jgi:hypothetical protein